MTDEGQQEQFRLGDEFDRFIDLLDQTSPRVKNYIDHAETAIRDGSDLHRELAGLAINVYFSGYRDNALNTISANKRAEAVAGLYTQARKFVKAFEEIVEDDAEGNQSRMPKTWPRK